MTDEPDYSDLEAKFAAIKLDETFDNVLIIESLPKVDAAKAEKLMAVLKKALFTPAGATIRNHLMPMDEASGLSKGYLFIEFDTVEQAEAVYKVAHQYRLDKAHVLYCIRFADYDRLLKVEDEYRPLQPEPYEEKEYLRGWLSDPAARDQFLTLAGQCVAVSWGGKAVEPVYQRPHWTDLITQWSPLGSYLVTFHAPGVMLWGGASWKQIHRFPQASIRHVQFSPNEAFLITWSPPDATRPADLNMLVWDVASGKLVRGFRTVAAEKTPDPESRSPIYPVPRGAILSFSHDDHFAYRIHEGQLFLYDAKDGFALVDKKPMDIPGLVECSWSPSEPLLSYWSLGDENTPSRVAVMQVPSKNIMRTKNLFNVFGCSVLWSTDGDFMAVQVNRHGKNKKQTMSNIEIFRLRDKNIPVEVVEMKSVASMMAWEPNGPRLAVAHNLEFNTHIDVFTMNHMVDGVKQVKLVKTLEHKPLSKMLWSPRGDYMAMASLDSTAAFIEFWNMSDYSLLNTKDHYLATDMEWDPTGRYLASWSSAWRHTMDNAYVIWDFKGEQLGKNPIPKLGLFAWRPRPASLLSREQIKEIRRNLKTYAAVFEEADRAKLDRESSDLGALRRRQISEWNEFRRLAILEASKLDDERELLFPKAADSKSRVVEEWVDEVIEEREESLTQ